MTPSMHSNIPKIWGLRLCDGKVGDDVLNRLRQVGYVLLAKVAGGNNSAEVVERAVEASGVYGQVSD